MLFVTVPVREPHAASSSQDATSIIGAVWLMQRIPGFNGAQSRQLLLTSVGFGVAAVITALLAFFVMTEIRGGVNMVPACLGGLESGLGERREQGSPMPLNEFGEVLQGIDKLAFSLIRGSRRKGLLKPSCVTRSGSPHWDSLPQALHPNCAIRSPPFVSEPR